MPTSQVDSPTTVASLKMDMPDFDKPDQDTRLVALRFIPETTSEGSIPENTTFKQTETEYKNAIVAITSWKNKHLAVGHFLIILDQHESIPDVGFSKIQETVPSLHDSFRKWEACLSPEERQNILKKLTSDRLENTKHSPLRFQTLQWEKALQTGSWRSTELNPEHYSLCEQALEEITPDGRSCYYTVLNSYLTLDDMNHGASITYCEGVALSTFTGMAMDHAWIEIENEVAEFTWPYHRFDPYEAVYFGQSVPHDTLKKRIKERGPTTTMILNKDEYRKRVREQKQILELV